MAFNSARLNPETSVVPNLLDRFLRLVLSGSNTPTPTISHLVNSIGQDICRAVTRGQWKLVMSLRHLFRSAELIVLLNRLGHTEKYCFLLLSQVLLSRIWPDFTTNNSWPNGSLSVSFWFL